jgi:hypothetical protein
MENVLRPFGLHCGHLTPFVIILVCFAYKNLATLPSCAIQNISCKNKQQLYLTLAATTSKSINPVVDATTPCLESLC